MAITSYFILNINYSRKTQVDFWLGQKGVAPIFYDGATIAQIREDRGHGLRPRQYSDAKSFVNTFSVDSVNEDAVIFSIGNEYVYIYKQAEPLKEWPLYKGGTGS